MQRPASIAALLSFYREDPAWLVEHIESLRRAGIQTLVACEGPYEHFPRSESVGDECRAVHEASQGMKLVYFSRTWPSEIDKRDFMFRAARRFADWCYIADGDEVILASPYLPSVVGGLEADVAEATVRLPKLHGSAYTVTEGPCRKLFRNLGLRVQGHHATYVTQDGAYLWGREEERLEPAVMIDGLVVEHRTNARPDARRQAAQDYYALRHELRLEAT